MGGAVSNYFLTTPVSKSSENDVIRDTVIIPVDPSQQAEAAFEWYVHHAHQMGNIVRILHCYDVTKPNVTSDKTDSRYFRHIHRSGNYVRVVHCRQIVNPSSEVIVNFTLPRYFRHIHRSGNYVRVVHCRQIVNPSSEVIVNFTLPQDFLNDKLENSRMEGMEVVNKFEKKLNDYKVKGSVESFIGHPGEVIVNNADKHKASMIVMGTRGFGLIRRTVLGSVSDYVVHHSKVPVTMVPKETVNWFF